MNIFYTFCTQYTIGTPFPVTEMLLCSFAVHLAEQGLAPQTIKGYLSAVRNIQLSLGLPDPREKSSLPVLKRVQAGIQRVRATKGPPSQLRLPITAAVLEQIGAHMRQSNLPQKDMLWAVCCTAFFGFFRLGELLPVSQASISLSTSLMWGDIAVDSLKNPTMVRVHLKRSKCDQFGKGADIILGKTGLSLCPVTAILKYVEIRGQSPGPFFRHSESQPVTKAWFVERIRDVLSAIGLPSQQYAGHSFRIGAATTAALSGVEDSTIQTLGRWHSAAFLQYIRMPSERLAGLSSVLARSMNSSTARS